MLYLLDRNSTTTKWNGEPLHEATYGVVKEVLNGDFFLHMKYPISDSNIYKKLREDMLIKAPTPDLGFQLFRIKKPIENNDHIDIMAYHISDDVMKRSISPMSAVNLGCREALLIMVQNAKSDLGRFAFTSDINKNRTFNTDENNTLYSVLLDGKHSIVGTWEGELVRDNYVLTVKKNRGQDRGVVITTHHNLHEYQRTRDSQNVVTRIYATSTFKAEGAEEDTVLSVTVESPYINHYPYVNEKEYANNDLRTVQELQKWAESKFKNEHIDLITDSIEIEAYEMDGQTAHLGDTVSLKSHKHDIDLYKKAIAYEFDALTQQYIKITFDNKASIGGMSQSDGLSSFADSVIEAGQNSQEVKIERALANANAAFDAAFDARKEAIERNIQKVRADAEVKANAIKEEIQGNLRDFDESFNEKIKEQNKTIDGIKQLGETNQEVLDEAKRNSEEAKRAALNALGKADTIKSEAIAEANRLIELSESALEDKITDVSSEVDTVKGQISQKVSQADFDRLNGTVNNQSTEISQTKQAIALKAEKTEVSGIKSTADNALAEAQKAGRDITQTKADLQVTNDTIKQLVTKSDFNAATGRLANAETEIRTQAGEITKRLTSTQVEQAITGKGYQTKAQVDSNITGRGYITNSALQPYVTSTVLENKVKETADGFERKITETKNLIPTDTDGLNLMTGTRDWSTKANGWHMGNNWRLENEEYLGLKVHSTNSGWNGSHQNIFVKAGDMITFSFYARADRELGNIKVSPSWIGSSVFQGPVAQTDKGDEIITVGTDWKRYSKTVKVISDGSVQFRMEHDGAIPNGNRLYVAGLKVAKSPIDKGYSDNPSDLVTETRFHTLQDTVDAHKRLIGDGTSLSKAIQSADKFERSIASGGELFQAIETARGLVTTVENLSVGSRNYVLNSDVCSSANEHRLSFSFENDLQTLRGKNVTISVDIDNTNAGGSAWGRSRNGFEISIVFQDNTVQFLGVWNEGADKANKKGRISQSHKVHDKPIKELRQRSMYNQFSSGSYKTCRPMIEFSSIPSDYKPAPEDTGSAVEAVKTEVSTLKDSWAVKHLTSAGSIASQINTSSNNILIEAAKIRHKGHTLVDTIEGISAKFDKIVAGEGNIVKLKSEIIDTNAIEGKHIKFDESFFTYFTADDAMVKYLFARKAFANELGAVRFTADQITSGTLKARNEVTNFNLDNGILSFNSNHTGVFREQANAATQGMMFLNNEITVNGVRRINSKTIIGAERRGNDLKTRWDKGGFNGIVIDTVRGVGTTDTEFSDRTSIVADRVRMVHTYSTEGSQWFDKPTGWEMKTYAPNPPHQGTVVLQPTGINQKDSTIIVGDIRIAINERETKSLKAVMNALADMWVHFGNGLTTGMVKNKTNGNVNTTMNNMRF